MSDDQSLRDRRHIDKIFYLGHDPLFYELNIDHYAPKDDFRSSVEEMISKLSLARIIQREGVWTHVVPTGDDGKPVRLPKQGWKIHVSATNRNSKEILEKVCSVVLPRDLAFKFANDAETLALMTSKTWHRGASGKFITIYPSDEAEFRSTIELLYQALKGYKASYILSDRRYKDSGCVYYRYGGIIPDFEYNFLGQKLHFIRAPDGEKIVDSRYPYFRLPNWVEDLFPSDDGDEDEALNDGRFTVQRALAFSNTGGVYLALDRETDTDVVLKEARPGIELSPSGEDSIDRLKQEEAILRTLAGTGLVPEVVGSFQEWENYFLAIEYLDADPMRTMMLAESPLIKIRPSREHSEKYYKLYKSVFIQVLKTVKLFHEKGIVIGDLSPVNIMVDRTTKEVKLIDLEGAFDPKLGEIKELHTPGFRSYLNGKPSVSNFENDRFAIGAIMLYCMFPISAMSFVRDDLYSTVLPVVAADIGWSDTPVVEIAQGLVSGELDCDRAIELFDRDAVIVTPYAQPQLRMLGNNSALPLEEMKQRLSEFIVGNYRLDEKFTLFPADPFGKETNDLGFGFGASGIIYALRSSGIDVPDEAQARYRRQMERRNFTHLPPGFLTGTAGMAWTSFLAEEVELGEELLQATNDTRYTDRHYSLYYGDAGVGMANLKAHLVTQKQDYLQVAEDCARRLVETAQSNDRGTFWPTSAITPLGFGYGQSGVALFLLRLSQLTGDDSWRKFGESALKFDLSYSHELEAGISSFSSEAENTNTYEPYIEAGSAGVAKVALRYGMEQEIEGVLSNLYRKYSGFPGLIFGLAGFCDALVDAYRYTGSTKYLEVAERPLRGIYELYLFQSGRGWAIPGENLFRVSCDFATGVAGVIHALQRRIHLLPDEFCLDELDSH